MNINMSKLISTLMVTSLPFFLILPATAEAASSHTSSKKNKKHSVTCDSFSRSKLLRKAKKYQPMITKAAQDYKVSEHLITAVITVESCFRSKVRSSAGAAGLMQLMPATARRFGVTKRYNSEHNIKAGTQYLKFLLKRYQGNVLLTAAAYNAGEGAVDKYNGVPPFKETKAYVRKVLNAYRKLSKSEKPKPIAQKTTSKATPKAKKSYTQRTRAWYIHQYKHKQSRRRLNLTANELHSVNRLLRSEGMRGEEMQIALNFKQFL